MTRHYTSNKPFRPSNSLLQPLSRLSCLILPLTLIISLTLATFVSAEETFTNEEILEAIFLAEGGFKADYLFGIRSVSYDSFEEARKICLNTIRNQRKRHAKHECDFTYLECLANRYAPPNVTNDPRNLNQFWLSNVRFFLRKAK